MDEFVCRKCGEKTRFGPNDVVMVLPPSAEGEPAKGEVRCQHCGQINVVVIPGQVLT